MAERSWFYASQGQQQGPYPEAQFRDLIARGAIRPDTLVWAEGMTGWQKAGEVPGLFSGMSAPPPLAPSGGMPVSGFGSHGSALAADLPLWAYFGRGLLFVIGLLLVIPAPWAATGFYRWLASRVQVPGRPNLAFTGQPMDIWYVFIILGLISYVGFSDNNWIQLVILVLQPALSWMIVRWVAANLSSNGERLPISFEGSPITYIGWSILLDISVITIIGWAWVIPAWMRWMCRNVAGTQREILFKASGLDVLWRTLLFAIGCAFVIPIPWVLRWYTSWYVSQFELAPRADSA